MKRDEKECCKTCEKLPGRIQIRVSPPDESLEPQGFGDSFFAFGVFLALFLAVPASKTLEAQGF